MEQIAHSECCLERNPSVQVWRENSCCSKCILFILTWQSALQQNQGERAGTRKGKFCLIFLGFFFWCCAVFYFFIHCTESINSLDCIQERNPERLLLFLSQYCSYTDCIPCSQLLDRTWVKLENPERSVCSLLSLLGCLLLSVSGCKECKIIFSSFTAGYFIHLYHSSEQAQVPRVTSKIIF